MARLLSRIVLAVLIVRTTSAAGCTKNCLRVFNIKPLTYYLTSAKAYVSVTNENGVRVRDAVVAGRWTLPDGTTLAQYRNIGTRDALFTLSPIGDGYTYPPGDYTLTILDVSKSGYTFDPDNSKELSETWPVPPAT